MRKLFFKEICKKAVLAIVGMLVLAFIYLFTVWVIDGKIKRSTAEGYIIPLVIGSKVFSNFRIRDAFFIIPLSKKDREALVKGNLFSICIAISLCLGFLECLLNQFEANILKVLFAGVLIVSATYCMMYAEYLEKTGSKHIVTIIFCTLFELVLMRAVVSCETIGWNCYGVVFTILVWSCCLFDYWLMKRFYRDMIHFFSDYEASRQILKEKVKA